VNSSERVRQGFPINSKGRTKKIINYQCNNMENSRFHNRFLYEIFEKTKIINILFVKLNDVMVNKQENENII